MLPRRTFSASGPCPKEKLEQRDPSFGRLLCRDSECCSFKRTHVRIVTNCFPSSVICIIRRSFEEVYKVLKIGRKEGVFSLYLTTLQHEKCLLHCFSEILQRLQKQQAEKMLFYEKKETHANIFEFPQADDQPPCS